MSLSGSAAFLVYGFICKALGKHVALKCRYFVLKLTVFFFLFPFSIFKYHVLNFIGKIIPFPEKEINQIFDTKSMIVINKQYTYVGSRIQMLWFYMLCMVVIFLCIMIAGLVCHLKSRRLFLSYKRADVPPKLKAQFDKLKTEWKITANVELVCTKECKEPVTIGILRPKILFPCIWKESFGDTSCEFMLKHELIHVRHWDLMVELLGLFVIAFHWYNPLSYLLYREILVMRELCCDEEIIGDSGEVLRKEYSHLLIDLAVQPFRKEERLAVRFLGRNKKVLERRILEMKEKRKPKVHLMVLVSVVTFLAGSATAFAYERPQIVNSLEDTSEIEGEYFFEEGMPKAEPVLYDSFWVNADGSIEEVMDNELEERIACNHIFKEGTYSQHKKNNSGGCTVIGREAKRCTLCGYVEMGEIINTFIYKKCPH